MPPGEFWVQTPRSFVAILDGRSRAAKQDYELAVAQAWHTEAFARTKRLKRLIDYLKEPKAQTPEEILAAFRSFQSHGAPMEIEQLEGG